MKSQTGTSSEFILKIIIGTIIFIILLYLFLYLLPFFIHFGTMDPEYKNLFKALVYAINKEIPFSSEIPYDSQNYNIVITPNSISVYDCKDQSFIGNPAYYFLNLSVNEYPYIFLDRYLYDCYLVYQGYINTPFDIKILSPYYIGVFLPPSSSYSSSFYSLSSQSSQNSNYNEIDILGDGYALEVTNNEYQYIFDVENISLSDFFFCPSNSISVTSYLRFSPTVFYAIKEKSVQSNNCYTDLNLIIYGYFSNYTYNIEFIFTQKV